MGKSADSIAAREKVYRQLRARFPKDAVEWAKTTQWHPAEKVALDQFDIRDEKNWAAYRSPEHVDLEIRQYEDGQNEPIVGVQAPGGKILIVDGHHRYLARQKMGKNRVLAYVGRVPMTEGPWKYTHLSQKGGDSG